SDNAVSEIGRQSIIRGATIMKPNYAIVASALFLLGVSGNSVLADGKKDCTTHPQSAWKQRAEAESVAKAAGHKVRGSKVEGSCYEIYAISKAGKKVELFYNPVDLKLMKTVVK
ncbi:MAG: PepSY domain-containing protein, partial [Planctomycetaceae bacterium]|nr:PepSY domain-containing protein [Planctomycetaceae bacterium]